MQAAEVLQIGAGSEIFRDLLIARLTPGLAQQHRVAYRPRGRKMLAADKFRMINANAVGQWLDRRADHRFGYRFIAGDQIAVFVSQRRQPWRYVAQFEAEFDGLMRDLDIVWVMGPFEAVERALRHRQHPLAIADRRPRREQNLLA